MRRGISVILACLFVSLLSASAQAGSLSVRLVRASHTAGGSSSGLGDVIPVFQKSLPYSHYSLAGSTSMTLPASKATRQLGGYSVTCSGSQNSLAITVKHGRKQLLNTSVRLSRGKPLILGGFPSGQDKLVLVFVAR
ncbi:MAG: hypothetical protein HN341_04270 [Verrucomicrobia bacterium]|jgi:hypothetical protein|nr:hypothetical protein [Verrucomicrobiota bacterium]